MSDRDQTASEGDSERGDGSTPPCCDAELGFRAHEWVIEPKLRRISGDTELRQVEPRAMDVLVDLTRRPGEVVSKDDLLDRVWGGIAVSPNVLTYSIASLRKALDDDWRSPRFIETISKGGYRWIAPVEPLAAHPTAWLAVLVVHWAIWPGRPTGARSRRRPRPIKRATERAPARRRDRRTPYPDPAGRDLIFSSYRAGQFTLWRVGIDDGSPPRPVAINDHQIGALRVSADNGRIVAHAVKRWRA